MGHTPSTDSLKLQIEIVEVLGLEMNPSDVVWPSIYVTVSTEKELFRTTIRELGLHHLFYESCEILVNIDSTLILEVWDKRTFSFDASFGKLEIHLNCIALSEGKAVKKSYPLGNGSSRIVVQFTAVNFSSNDQSLEREKDFDKRLIEGRKDKIESEKLRVRKDPSVSKYYRELDEIVKMVDDDSKVNDVLLRCQALIAEIEKKIRSDNSDTLNVQKTWQYFRGVRTFAGRNIPLVECLGDGVCEEAKCLMKIGETDLEFDLLKKFELDYYPHVGCSNLLDLCEVACVKGEHYEILNGHRIHCPRKYDGKGWPPNLRKEIVAIFFSWVVYEHRPRWMFGRAWNQEIDKRLTGYGDWRIMNQIHVEDYAVNFHCIFSLNQELGTVILAIRGTEFNLERKMEMAKGWFSNLTFNKISFPIGNGVKVHKGYYDQYMVIKEEIVQQVENYLKQGYRLICTGHSQGAGIATIMAAHLGYLYGELATKNVSVVTFGSPRVGNSEFAKLFDKMYPDCMRFVAKRGNTLDIVTTIPPELVGFQHVGKETFIPANPKYYGNPTPIPGISISCDVNQIDSIMLHIQQSYCDGLIDKCKETSNSSYFYTTDTDSSTPM